MVWHWKKVHQIVRFEERYWMKSYIVLNTKWRTAAKNEIKLILSWINAIKPSFVIEIFSNLDSAYRMEQNKKILTLWSKLLYPNKYQFKVYEKPAITNFQTKPNSNICLTIKTGIFKKISFTGFQCMLTKYNIF